MGKTEWPIIYGRNLNKVVYGVFAESIGTKTLKWETTEQWGVGLDVGLFNND